MLSADPQKRSATDQVSVLGRLSILKRAPEIRTGPCPTIERRLLVFETPDRVVLPEIPQTTTDRSTEVPSCIWPVEILGGATGVPILGFQDFWPGARQLPMILIRPTFAAASLAANCRHHMPTSAAKNSHFGPLVRTASRGRAPSIAGRDAAVGGGDSQRS